MTPQEFDKRLDEILELLQYAHNYSDNQEPYLTNQRIEAKAALKELFRDAIGDDIEIDYDFGVGDDRPDVTNNERDRLRTIIGVER